MTADFVQLIAPVLVAAFLIGFFVYFCLQYWKPSNALEKTLKAVNGKLLDLKSLPSNERKKLDRAYRIGQTKDVTVCYPTVVSEGMTTFEETLDRLLERRRGLATDMLTVVNDLDLREFVNWRFCYILSLQRAIFGVWLAANR